MLPVIGAAVVGALAYITTNAGDAEAEPLIPPLERPTTTDTLVDDGADLDQESVSAIPLNDGSASSGGSAAAPTPSTVADAPAAGTEQSNADQLPQLPANDSAGADDGTATTAPPTTPAAPATSTTSAPAPASPAVPSTTEPQSLESAVPPSYDTSRVNPGADIADHFAGSDLVAAGLSVLRNSGPLPALVADHPEITNYLQQEIGNYSPTTASLADAVAGAYERALLDLADDEALLDSGLCVITGVANGNVRCAQLPELWSTPSVNLMRSVALAQAQESLSGADLTEVEQLINTNFSGGTLWAVARGANAAFLAAELRIAWASQDVPVRSSDANVAGHLLFLAVYADESRTLGGDAWSALLVPDVQIPFGTLWNMGRGALWSDDERLVEMVWTSRTTAVSELSLQTANLAEPY